MLERLGNWLKKQFSDGESSRSPVLRQSGIHHLRPQVSAQAATRQEPEDVDFESQVPGKIEDGGPGKNILVRNQYIREETGTYETLKIVNDSLDDEDDGFSDDPYNTGGFDRSKNWGNRFRK